jgi:hypothetical protein
MYVEMILSRTPEANLVSLHFAGALHHPLFDVGKHALG